MLKLFVLTWKVPRLIQQNHSMLWLFSEKYTFNRGRSFFNPRFIMSCVLLRKLDRAERGTDVDARYILLK